MSTRLIEVSRVMNELRMLNKDEYFSRRAILKMLEDKISFLLSQKNGEKNLYREENLFSTLKCFELEQVEVVDCDIVEFRLCKTLMKSKHKLPETISSKYFNNILSVTSVDWGQVFKPLTLREYSTKNKRKYSNLSQLYYFISDDYLYIPDFEVQAVNIELMTLRLEELVSKSNCSKDDCCKSYWEYPLIKSDKLAEAAVREVIQELLGTAKNIPKDENPNLDSNIKSKTTQ